MSCFYNGPQLLAKQIEDNAIQWILSEYSKNTNF